MVTKESVTMKSKFGETSKHNTKHNTEHSKAQSTVKHNTKLKLLHVGQMLKPKISLYSECKDDLDVWSKKYYFKTVHTGVNKLVSNNSSVGFYKSARGTQFVPPFLKAGEVNFDYLPQRGGGGGGGS